MENAGRSLKGFLSSLEKGELVDLLLSAAERNHSLREEVSSVLRTSGPPESWPEFVERLKRRHPRKMSRLRLPG